MQEIVAEVPDALFFVAVHQITELWFKVILVELQLAGSAMGADDIGEAVYRLERVVRVEDVLVAQLRTLETLGARSFAAIRTQLGASSGFQSAQFREIEILSGLRDRDQLDAVGLAAEEYRRLRARLAAPSLMDAFEALHDRRGRPDLRRVMIDRSDPELLTLVERLLDHDEGIARWRSRHALMVERVIGYQAGTGGTSGVDYLRSTIGRRFFPKLWQIRSSI